MVLTAKEARELSDRSQMEELIGKIKEAAKRGKYQVQCSSFVTREYTTEADVMEKYWSKEVKYLVNLGYSVRVEKQTLPPTRGFYPDNFYYLVASW